MYKQIQFAYEVYAYLVKINDCVMLEARVYTNTGFGYWYFHPVMVPDRFRLHKAEAHSRDRPVFIGTCSYPNYMFVSIPASRFFAEGN